MTTLRKSIEARLNFWDSEIDKDIAKEEALKKALDDYVKIFEDYVSQHPSHYCRTLYDRAVDSRRTGRIRP